MEEFDKLKKPLISLVNQINDLSDYVRNYLEIPCGIEFQHHLNNLKKPLKVLDIGCGRGETSVLLAQQGHEVHAVEPSLAMCEVIASLSSKFSLPIKAYQAIGETIDLLSEEDFDLCIFNASFHHCEDPSRVLENCYKKLKRKGKIFLLNEPILKFYRSKQWYQNALEKFPEEMGHYGGNEHIYYFKEYQNFLAKAGFSEIKDHFHKRLYHPRIVIRDDMNKKVSDSKLIIKYFILFIFKGMLMNKWLSKTVMAGLKRLSLVPMSFEGIKS